MREIKFRAWDEVNHCMLPDYDNWIDFDGGYFTTPEKGFDTPFTEIVRKEGVILMQYTGLKDKNGKEIYEGDIISTSYGKVGSVVYHNERACFILHDSSHFNVSLYEEMPFIEVIGNIYENPEYEKA